MNQWVKDKETDVVIKYLYYMMRRQDEKIRDLSAELSNQKQKQQTYDIFDYKWNPVGEWESQENPAIYTQNLKSSEYILNITGLPAEWFQNKKILDAGCGNGKLSYGLCELGAQVVSIDQSSHGIQRVNQFCQSFETHKGYVHDILTPIPDKDFDLIFSFGVIHHTGNTELALKQLSKSCAEKGKVFLMVYGYPEQLPDFYHDVEFLYWHSKMENLSQSEQKEFISRHKNNKNVDGWYDAAGPKIEDHYSYEQLSTLLKKYNFVDIKKTKTSRHPHILATKVTEK